MDYTTLPRSLIYRERRSLEEFGVYERESITRPLAEAMLRMDFIQYLDSEKRALWCMNTAYYICTMILLETDPRWRLSQYKKIAFPEWAARAQAEDLRILTLSLAGLLLSRLEEPIPLLSRKGQTRNHFVSIILDNGEFNLIFKQLYEQVEADRYIKGTIPNSAFAPRVIDKECIHDVMSDSDFNWVSFTNFWEERTIQDIVKCLGTSEDEKHNVIDILRQSSHGFYSAGCNDHSEQVDAMFDDIDQKIYLEYNPQDDHTMEDDNSELRPYLKLKPWEEVRIDQLTEENAILRDEIHQIKKIIKGAITYDEFNEVQGLGDFYLSVEDAKKIVSDAITRAENRELVAYPLSKKDLVEYFGDKREENTEDEKDKLLSELREKNMSLTNEVNRLKLENDELHQIKSEGGATEWIGCFDGFLHASLNPQAIAKALEAITHSYFSKKERGYWWVFVTVLTEINWIPKPNYKLALKWANLHFNCGWDWNKDNQFKFSDINEKIRSVQPSSKWNKSVTGNVIGDYYGELAKTMKDTFVSVVNDNHLLDKSEFIKPKCRFINDGRK